MGHRLESHPVKGPFNVHASVQCKPGSASEFEALLKETVRLSNQEEGTLEYKAGREADKGLSRLSKSSLSFTPWLTIMRCFAWEEEN